MKIIPIAIAIAILASLACMTSTIPADTATKSATSTPTQTAIVHANNDEPASGTVFEIPTAAPLCATVTAIQSLHLRDQPNERAQVLAYLHNGEQVRVIAFLPASRGQAGGQWWKLSTSQGTGYANAKYLRLAECAP